MCNTSTLNKSKSNFNFTTPFKVFLVFTVIGASIFFGYSLKSPKQQISSTSKETLDQLHQGQQMIKEATSKHHKILKEIKEANNQFLSQQKELESFHKDNPLPDFNLHYEK